MQELLGYRASARQYAVDPCSSVMRCRLPQRDGTTALPRRRDHLGVCVMVNPFSSLGQSGRAGGPPASISGARAGRLVGRIRPCPVPGCWPSGLTTTEIGEAIATGPEHAIARLDDPRWFHWRDKAYGGHAACPDDELTTAFVTWITTIRFEPTLVAARIARAVSADAE
jgi:hypothetical protein